MKPLIGSEPSNIIFRRFEMHLSYQSHNLFMSIMLWNRFCKRQHFFVRLEVNRPIQKQWPRAENIGTHYKVISNQKSPSKSKT